MKTLKQVRGDGAPTIILEPMPKNTAPAIAAACCAAMKQDKDAVVVVLPRQYVVSSICRNVDLAAKLVR